MVDVYSRCDSAAVYSSESFASRLLLVRYRMSMLLVCVEIETKINFKAIRMDVPWRRRKIADAAELVTTITQPTTPTHPILNSGMTRFTGYFTM